MLNKKPEDVEVIFSKLVAAYPELTVADKDLPDLLPKKDRKKFKESSWQWGWMHKTLRTLDQAQRDTRRRNVFFQTCKDRFWKDWKKFQERKMPQLLKLTDFFQVQAYFLINLFELTEKYNKLAFSNLLLRFFKTNLKIFKTICVSDHDIFI